MDREEGVRGGVVLLIIGLLAPAATIPVARVANAAARSARCRSRNAPYLSNRSELSLRSSETRAEL